MPVEQIYIVVTEDGIRSFKWKGMSQEEKIVTENVKLLAFDEIETADRSGEISLPFQSACREQDDIWL